MNKNMKTLPVILLCAVLSGRAANSQTINPRLIELNQYAEAQRPLAVDGKIKWSDYYRGLRERQIAAGMSYEVVHLASELEFYALAYEKGGITKDEFERHQHFARNTITDIALRERQATEAREQANKALALQALMNMPSAP